MTQQSAALFEEAKYCSVFPGSDLVAVSSSAAGEQMLTGQSYVAAQHEGPWVLDGDDDLKALFVRVGGELVSFQPQTDGELLVFLQGGVQQLRTAVSVW